MTPMRFLLALSAALLLASVSPLLGEEPGARVLFLSKSSTFVHPAIAWPDGEGPSHVDRVLASLAEKHGFELVATKDAGLLNAEDLAGFDAVVFYTTGDLAVSGAGEGLFGGDGMPAMPAGGLDALLDWVRSGGAFLGFHSASDTFHGEEGEEISPYIEMLGGEFRIHGLQFAGTVRVVDPDHPAMASFPEEWTVLDEWYLFENLGAESIHVLALLDPGPERAKQELYDVPVYPVVWCRTYGEGRVYYNAMGHREDVWDAPQFQHSVLAALHWALGGGEAGAEPNYAAVVPAPRGE